MREKRSRHGLNRAMVHIKLRGLQGIDRRTSAARGLLQWRAQLIVDLGGVENISSQKAALVDLAARTKALLDHADSWLLGQGSIINKRKKSLLPVVMQRQTLCDSLARLLAQLGLERQAKPIPALKDYIEAKGSSA